MPTSTEPTVTVFPQPDKTPSQPPTSTAHSLPFPILTDLNPENLKVSDLPDAIVEEDEEDTASEAMEPITPTSDAAPRGFPLPTPDHQHQHQHQDQATPAMPMPMPVLIQTPATPPTSTTPVPRESKPILVSRPSTASVTTSGAATPQAGSSTRSSPTRPSPLRTASRSLKSLFRRTPSDARDSNASKEAFKETSKETSPTRTAKPVPPPIPTTSISSMFKNSMSLSPRNSPTASHSGSPPSPGSPASTVNGDGFPQLSTSSPGSDSFMRKPPRSTTGLSLRVRDRVKFGATPQPQRPTEHRIRSPSLGDVRNQGDRPGFSIPAEVGVGLKARRMSSSLPDDFTVDTCELTEEFASPSRVPGRRGKECGRGATATVRIMCRKGASRDVQYAVKEFRKRGQKEDQDEYEKKVKSEFSIANSLHHPNIVETVRLCTNNGRWNHVMEYCSYGELFSLVQKNYLQPKDNMCLFKQVVRGIAYLHENGIAHRDIKLENLLLSEEGHVKITDFGVSEVFSGIHPGLRSANGKCGQDMKEVRLCSPGICGSLPYIAPEVLAKKESYDPRPLDVWSCAIVYLTLHYKGNPWPAADSKHTNYERFATGWAKYLEKFPDGLVLDDRSPSCGPVFRYLNNSSMRRLLLRMLHPDPQKRISIQAVLQDRHYKSIECCAPDLLKDPSKAVTSIDAAGKGSCKMANKMLVQKMHNHFPPEKRFMPPHRFDTED